MNDTSKHLQLKNRLQELTGLPWDVSTDDFGHHTINTYIPQSVVDSPFDTSAVRGFARKNEFLYCNDPVEKGENRGFGPLDEAAINRLLGLLQTDGAQKEIKEALKATRAIVLLEKLTGAEWQIIEDDNRNLYARLKDVPVEKPSLIPTVLTFVAGALTTGNDPRTTEILPRMLGDKPAFHTDCLIAEPVLQALQNLFDHPEILKNIMDLAERGVAGSRFSRAGVGTSGGPGAAR